MTDQTETTKISWTLQKEKLEDLMVDVLENVKRQHF